jgi:alpha-tubulin suppressor-like RCC1 family protein
MAGIKISQLISGGAVASPDEIPVARGAETYKVSLRQFVTTGENIGNGGGLVYAGESETSSTSLKFRTIKGSEGIGVENDGDTIVLSTSGQNPVKTKFFGNGVTKEFNINSANSLNPNNYRVDIDGVLQEADSDYFISGSTIYFTDAPPLSSKVVVVSNNLIRSIDGSSTVIISDTAPQGVSLGTLWYDSSAGDCSIYYNDGDSFQWVDIAGSNVPSVTVSDTPPTNAIGGSLWYNSSNGVFAVYYEDGSSSQWVDVGNSGDNVIDFNTINSNTINLNWNTSTNTLCAELINKEDPINSVLKLPDQGSNNGGSDSTFFIMKDGSLRFCGRNRNYHGGVGGVSSDVIVLPKSPAFNPPLKIDERIEKIYSQGRCSYAITNSGSLYVAGENSLYQLGTNTVVDIKVFTRTIKSVSDSSGDGAVVLAGDKIKSLAAGSGSSDEYLTVFAITEQGKVYVWGYNGATLKRAGLNSTATYITTPTQVTLGLPTDDPVIEIVGAGNNQNMCHIVRTQSGKLYSIGEGGDGAIASGSTTDRQTFAEVVGLPSGYAATTVVSGGEANNLSSWAILSDGSVWGTGYNNQGQTNPSQVGTNQLSFTQITALNGLNITKFAIHADSSRTSIWALGGPIGAHTSARAWGANLRGQLGLGDIVSPKTTPTQNLSWPFFEGGATIVDMIVAGNDDNKATVVIDSTGKIWAAGYNSTYLCGNGDTISPQNTFKRVLFNESFGKPIKLVSRNDGVNDAVPLPKSCVFVLLDTGNVLAWGYDNASVGQLGVDAAPNFGAIPSFVIFTS